MNRRRRPPYARELAAALAEPATWQRFDGTSADRQRITAWVVLGSAAWRLARDGDADVQFSRLGSGAPWEGHRLFLLLPPGENAGAYDWSLLAHSGVGGAVLIAQAGRVEQQDVHHLADALLRDGVRAVLADGPSGLVRYSSARSAAA